MFDWDVHNLRHVTCHHVTAGEFEEAMFNSPIELEWEIVDGEDRYHAVGMTNSGRLLYMVWTPRENGIRAVTAYNAGPQAKREWNKQKR